jgi:hypothetical protein
MLSVVVAVVAVIRFLFSLKFAFLKSFLETLSESLILAESAELRSPLNPNAIPNLSSEPVYP